MTPRLCAMPDEEDEPECFICTESTPPLFRSECLCRNRYVHRECFVKLLESQTGIACAVCGAPYANVRIKIKRVVQLTSPFGVVAAMACTFMALAGCLIDTNWIHLNEYRKIPEVLVLVNLCMSMGVMGSVGIAVYHVRRYGWRGVWDSRYAEKTLCMVGPARSVSRTETMEIELGELV